MMVSPPSLLSDGCAPWIAPEGPRLGQSDETEEGGQKGADRRGEGTAERDRSPSPMPRVVNPATGHAAKTPQTSTLLRLGFWGICDTVGQVGPLKLDKIKLTKEFIAV